MGLQDVLEKKVLDLLGTDRKIKQTEIAKRLNVSIASVQRVMKRMVDYQLLYELDDKGKRRFQICPPKTIEGIRKIPLTSKALHALSKHLNLTKL